MIPRKYSAVIRVILPENRLPKSSSPFALDPAVHGYYQNVSVFAPSESEAKAIVSEDTRDGDIDWSQTAFDEVEKQLGDWIRILLGYRILRNSGRVFFPREQTNPGHDDIIGWRTVTKKRVR